MEDNNMMYFESAITDFLNSLLNTDSQTEFILSQYIKLSKKGFTVKSPDGNKNTYKTKTTRYTPAMLRAFDGDFAPLEDEETGDFVIPISFFVRYDVETQKVEYNKILNDINSFRKKLIGKFYDLSTYFKDEENAYNTVWTTSGMSGVGEPISHNGELFDEIDLTLSLDFGLNFEYGNQSHYYIAKVKGLALKDKEKLKLFIRQSDRTKNLESSQAIKNAQETNHIAKTNVWGVEASFYPSSGGIAKEIKKSVDDPTMSQNTVYYLTLVDPDYTIVDIPVITDGATKSPPLGEKVVISTNFLLANPKIEPKAGV